MTSEQRRISSELRAVVVGLAVEIGERHVRKPERLAAAALFVEESMRHSGLTPIAQEYVVAGVPCRNLESVVLGREAPTETVVVGAHYDSAIGTPGADDNASGVAVLLYLAAVARREPPRRTVRFVAFVNEEPPYFRTRDMGSVRYADAIDKNGLNVVAMLSLETMGYYVDGPKSQAYPQPLDWVFPDVGNFIAFTGNSASAALIRSTVGSFRKETPFPALGAALAGSAGGLELSDHWAFSRRGIPALMVTDTAMHRNPHYHHQTDTIDGIDFGRLARVAEGLARVIRQF
jgi:Zn-dependent M28 family amino/carboxypeptidase